MANTQANNVLSISSVATPDALTQAGYEALVWIPIGNVGSLGESGINTNVLSYDTLTTDVSDKAKGISDAGSPQVEVARVYNDAGQVALRAAAATNLKYSFKLERTDSPDGILSNTVIYNRGLVTGPTRPGGRNEDFDLEVFTLGLVQTEIVVDPA